MNPAQLQRLLQTALNHHQAGRLAEAEPLYRQARVAAPKHFDALHLSGVLAYQQNRFADAADLLARAHKLDPKSAACEMRLGLALDALGRTTDAEKHYRNSLRLDTRMPETWNNLAVTLRRQGRFAEAADAYRRAIELKPDYYDAHDRLGALLADTQGLAAGIPHFRRAVQLKPDYAIGWCNLGLALVPEGKFSEALDCFSRSLAADPTLTQARVGQGLVLQQSYRLEEAAKEYGVVIDREPRHYEAHSARLLTQQYLATRTREEMFNSHLDFGQAAESAAPAPVALPNSRDPRKRLRLAFFSPDLRSHSVAYFIEPILRHLDPTQFEVILYHDHFQSDHTSDRLRGYASLWRNFVGQSAEVVEKQIRADAPDILVDLAGHTGYNRLPLYARRLAPVQLSYLGYPDTTGLRAMDYRLVDAITDPGEEDQKFHTEKLIRFATTAWAYQPPTTAPDVPPPSCANGAPVTFGSFNNFAKVSDTTLRLWKRLLDAVPGSRLLLKGHSLDEKELGWIVADKFQRAGLDPARVQLLGRTPNIQSHLSVYAQVDIALDPFPYHGTTTTCEALWMGRPVVTLLGDRHAARVSASLLTAIGHPEWIAHSEDDYVRIATELANAPGKLKSVGETLRTSMQASPLLDHASQSSRFATALRHCWETWCAGT